MGAKRPEPAPPKFQPVMMDEQGNYYKENPEYTKKMAKLRSHPFTMMGAAKNPSKFKKDGMPDQYIAISGDLKPTSVESRSGYGKAKSYNPNREV